MNGIIALLLSTIVAGSIVAVWTRYLKNKYAKKAKGLSDSDLHSRRSHLFREIENRWSYPKMLEYYAMEEETSRRKI